MFSIAIHIMNGYQDGNFANKMPGKLFYTMDKDICWEISDNEITFLLEKQQYNDGCISKVKCPLCRVSLCDCDECED